VYLKVRMFQVFNIFEYFDVILSFKDYANMSNTDSAG
jgi:hypothetical protein